MEPDAFIIEKIVFCTLVSLTIFGLIYQLILRPYLIKKKFKNSKPYDDADFFEFCYKEINIEFPFVFYATMKNRYGGSPPVRKSSQILNLYFSEDSILFNINPKQLFIDANNIFF